MPHAVGNDRAPGNLYSPGTHHRRAVVNEEPPERIGLLPSGIDSLACLDPIPGRNGRMCPGQRQDRAIPQNAAESKYREQAVKGHVVTAPWGTPQASIA